LEVKLNGWWGTGFLKPKNNIWITIRWQHCSSMFGVGNIRVAIQSGSSVCSVRNLHVNIYFCMNSDPVVSNGPRYKC
jgi:hypothetical protein